jgi:membrane-bound lytic murein transglycosylase A
LKAFAALGVLLFPLVGSGWATEIDLPARTVPPIAAPTELAATNTVAVKADSQIEPDAEATGSMLHRRGQVLRIDGPGDEVFPERMPEAIAPIDVSPVLRTPPSLQSFATKHARYVSVGWAEIPNWHDGVTAISWAAFVESCAVLVRRSQWRDVCERAIAGPNATGSMARDFFEREFEAFQIRTIDARETGTLTGYYEPLLEGSRTRTARFRYPVYGIPNDLLFLDARLLNPRRPLQHVQISGRDVVPAIEDAQSPQRPNDRKIFKLAVTRAPAITRDRKIRVRIAGDRIVPYYTRQEIERRDLIAAPPIAWVDDPDVLYALHIEGSGRIRLPSGEVLRVSYGEQNGHAFRPTVWTEPAQLAQQRPRATTPQDSAAVQQIIDFLVPSAAAAETHPLPHHVEGSERHPNAMSEVDRPRIIVSSKKDPSFVFFRQIPHKESGPPGAMGIPLTANASLAVDPRVTPLGAPVFITARPSGSTVTTQQLMVAQDTGGAIQGALRADYFLGFGATAAASAMRMKDELRMWVLLPKRLDIAAQHSEIRANKTHRAQCLLPDPDFCAH